jgi:hypothetical protein
MTDDRKLLELAAKAAGIHHSGWDDEEQCMTAWFDDPADKSEAGSWGIWNPLEDDGEALRLAVKLGMEMQCHLGAVMVCCAGRRVDERFDFTDDGATAATRRAIVRAAAALVKD